MSNAESSLISDEQDLREINRDSNIFFAPFLLMKNVLNYKGLLVNSIKRDMKLQYRDSAFGYFWTLFEPLLLTIIYYLFFTIVVERPDRAYAFWVIIGVITWSLFSKGMLGVVNSLYSSRNMLKAIYFPRELFPIGKICSQSIISLLSLVVAIPFMIFFEQPLNINILMVPIGIFLAFSLALGLGMLLSPFNVINTDVSHMVKILLRAGFFLSPVMWTIEMIPSRSEGFVQYIFYNPMVVPITMVRNGFRGIPLGVETYQLWYSILFCLFAIIIGSMVFKKFESKVVKFL